MSTCSISCKRVVTVDSVWCCCRVLPHCWLLSRGPATESVRTSVTSSMRSSRYTYIKSSLSSAFVLCAIAPGINIDPHMHRSRNVIAMQGHTCWGK